MLLRVLLFVQILLPNKLYAMENGNKVKPYVVLPVPYDMPNRNDRSDQCWLRIEDEELVETLTVYCYIAHAFLKNYIRDYNSRKLTEDGVEVSLWSEEPRSHDEYILTKNSNGDQKGLKDWRVTTVLDPVTHMRLYVSLKADCKLIMYSREGMSNYNVDCEKLLYFFNSRMSGAVISRVQLTLLGSAIIFLIFSM